MDHIEPLWVRALGAAGDPVIAFCALTHTTRQMLSVAVDAPLPGCFYFFHPCVLAGTSPSRLCSDRPCCGEYGAGLSHGQSDGARHGAPVSVASSGRMSVWAWAL